MTLNGSDLMLFVEVNGSYKSIAYATNHTLNISMNQIDTSTKDNGQGFWSNSEPGLMSFELSTENLMNDDGDDNGLSFNSLFDLMLQRTTVDVVFSLETNNQNFQSKADNEFDVPTGGWTYDKTNNYHGKVYITSLQCTATNGEKSTYSATFTGAGPLLKTGNGIEKKK